MLFGAEIGESDCEALGVGVFHQPVNAISSFAYVIVGVAVVALAARRGVAVGRSIVYGACLAAVGLGSVAFHGPQPDGSRPMHDLPIVVTLLFMIASDAERLMGRRGRWAWWGFAVLSAISIAVGLVVTDFSSTASGLLVVVLVIVESSVYRRGLRASEPAAQRRAYLGMAIVLAIAAVFWLLGRTGSPICEPGSLWQAHGLWHAISAVPFGIWWWLELDARISAVRGRGGAPGED